MFRFAKPAVIIISSLLISVQARSIDQYRALGDSDLSIKMFYSGIRRFDGIQPDPYPARLLATNDFAPRRARRPPSKFPAGPAADLAFLQDSGRTLLPDNQDSSINTGRLALVGGTLLGSMLAVHLYQQSGWWRDNRTPFHFQEDLVYGLNVDKFGHFYGACLIQYLISRSLNWANISEENSVWIGSGGALLFQTYVEVEDGFSTWGFDRVDFASDVAGAAFPIARYYIPCFQNTDVKLSYHPSSLLGNPGGIGFQGQKHIMIDDYEGQTLWLSVKVHNLLPEAAKPYWPGFLCLALGYGARDIAGSHPFKVYFLALDFDMTKLIPPNTPLLKTLGEALNLIHFPAPALQFYPNAIFYGFYF